MKIPFFLLNFTANCILKITRNLLKIKFDCTYLSFSVTKTNRVSYHPNEPFLIFYVKPTAYCYLKQYHAWTATNRNKTQESSLGRYFIPTNWEALYILKPNNMLWIPFLKKKILARINEKSFLQTWECLSIIGCKKKIKDMWEKWMLK